MLFPDSFIEEIKQRLPLSKVISARIKLERKGNTYLGLCPFHHEKSPSFNVNDHRGQYYCFGCHAHGDLINFVSQIEKLPFTETVKYLASLSGLSLPKMDIGLQRQEEKKLNLIDILNKVSEWFSKQLKLSTNHNAYEYLLERGINGEDIKTFSIGFAPEQGLINFLKKEKIPLNMAAEAGVLANQEGRIDDFYERFRNRIIFPIKNQKNQIVGFGGRALDSTVMPKYLNSPETALFKKNQLLYLSEIAHKQTLKTDRAIVVEGYIDAIFMHKANLSETVATLGTAFNQQHLTMLWKIANEPIICFDGDIAGKKAMLKAAHVALPLLTPGFSLKFCSLPKNQDPDEIIKQYGSEYMHRLLNNSISLIDFIWQTEFEQYQPNTPDQKALFEQKIYDLIEQIQNKLVQNHYRKFVQNKLWQIFNNFKSTNKSINKKNKKIIDIKSTSDLSLNNLTIKERLEYSLLAQLISHHKLILDQDIYSEFLYLELENSKLEKLRACLLEYHDNQNIDLDTLLDQNNSIKIKELLCGPQSSFIDKISETSPQLAKEVWLITAKKYLLELLKNEYSQCLQKTYQDDKFLIRANELKQSIEILTKDIILKESNLSQEPF